VFIIPFLQLLVSLIKYNYCHLQRYNTFSFNNQLQLISQPSNRIISLSLKPQKPTKQNNSERHRLHIFSLNLFQYHPNPRQRVLRHVEAFVLCPAVLQPLPFCSAILTCLCVGNQCRNMEIEIFMIMNSYISAL
jgi:hypothetical protein